LKVQIYDKKFIYTSFSDIFVGRAASRTKKPPKGWFFCGSRRAMRGSLRSYLRAARLVRGFAAPLLSLSQNAEPFTSWMPSAFLSQKQQSKIY
jgi:hypothetical protein